MLQSVILLMTLLLVPITQVAYSLQPPPPNTWYGNVHGGNGFMPKENMSVVATIGNKVCGQDHTRTHEGRIVYTIDIFATGQDPDCGAPGRTVQIKIDGRLMWPTHEWNGPGLSNYDLNPGYVLHIPTVLYQ